MTDPPVLAEVDGAVGLARLNRPQQRNALTPELMDALATVVEGWDADPSVRCIVVAGTASCFGAGAEAAGTGAVGPAGDDPAPPPGGSARQAQATESSARFWLRMAGCRTPLVAAVSGYALGDGWELALLCDIVVASESAEFGQPEVHWGVVPGGGATQRITRAAGRQQAMELILTGRRIDVHEALRLGLVNRVTPKKKWLEQALEVAHVVARRPPLAVQLAKQAVNAAEESGLAEGLAQERRLHERSLKTEDRAEAVRALAERRRPEFKGR